ncbi:hypothetical protein [uncultured Chryseobacterium sp.]|nr:hypothetical protein [uncultured Chryseobacterium sp.]
MSQFKGKSIIIAAPNHYGLLQRFKENLEALGFNVTVIPDDIKVYIGLKNNLIHIYKKLFNKNSEFKREKKIELRTTKQIEILIRQNIKQFDYALFVRPDLFSDKLIQYVKERTFSTAAYQWDGMDRFPSAYKKIDLFDRFFVFDKTDHKKNEKLIPITNFYFDDIPAKANTIDAYFIGTYMESRMGTIIKLAKKFKNLGLNTSINLIAKTPKKLKNIDLGIVNLTNRPVSFKENIINSSKSRIILDFVNDVHHGISMRTFESIGFRKKLITNNLLVKDYDFYNPSNIFVIENDNFEGIEDFINTSYENLPEDIYDKYSFKSWIKYVLNIV